ncbi:hypothetical protein [Flavobacterium sp.]|uniref:hypothetical protein n=1 Tax=Flavobacterium sp. TaxID=239 RepID=UPI0039E52AEE
MKEQKLKEYFENLITAEELFKDLDGSQKQTSYDVSSIYIEQIEDGEFEITKTHLIKICDDFIDGNFSAIDVNTIASALSFSEFFVWGGNTKEHELIAEVIYDWDNPQMGFALSLENFRHWREYLETGYTKYLTKEELKKKLRGVKKNDPRRRNGI